MHSSDSRAAQYALTCVVPQVQFITVLLHLLHTIPTLEKDKTEHVNYCLWSSWSEVMCSQKVFIERERLHTLLWSSLQTSLNRCSLILSPATYSTSLDSPVSLLPLLITSVVLVPSVGGSTVAACSHTCTHTHTLLSKDEVVQIATEFS